MTTSWRARAAAAVAVALALGGCSPGDGPTEPAAAPETTTATAAAPGSSLAPTSTAAGAVAALLDAEVRSDHEASYRLLTPEGRATYPTVAEWARRRSELPAITRFALEGEPVVAEGATRVAVTVNHEPGLDPFVGLSAATERQTWFAHDAGGGSWLVEADPEVQPLLPPDGVARDAALRWARAVQACDPQAALADQALAIPLGQSEGVGKLCRSSGALEVGSVEPVPQGVAVQELVSQYGTDAPSWARAVRVTAPLGSFSVFLAPWDDTWKIVGVSDA